MIALAIIFLITTSIVCVIDVASQFDNRWAIRVKWSLVWYAARYIGIASASLMALETMFER